MSSNAKAPADSGKWEDLLTGLINRVVDPSRRFLDCGAGWYPILADLESKLAATAPDTELAFIGESDGELVVALLSDNLSVEELVRDAAARAARTCEFSGGSGVVMDGPAGRRVLNPSLASEEWRVASDLLLRCSDEHSAHLASLLIECREALRAAISLHSKHSNS